LFFKRRVKGDQFQTIRADHVVRTVRVNNVTLTGFERIAQRREFGLARPRPHRASHSDPFPGQPQRVRESSTASERRHGELMG